MIKPEASAKLEAASAWIHKCLTESEPDNDSSWPPIWSQKDLEGFTERMLLDLRAIFEHFVEAFNYLKVSLSQNRHEQGNSEPSGPEGAAQSERVKSVKKDSDSLKSIYIYDLAGKKSGFMLFRQGHRLIFTPEAPGRIRIQLAKKAPGVQSIGEPAKCVDSCLRAVANNVMSLKWVHDKYPGFVDIEALAHYYMKYFLQESGG